MSLTSNIVLFFIVLYFSNRSLIIPNARFTGTEVNRTVT